MSTKRACLQNDNPRRLTRRSTARECGCGRSQPTYTRPVCRKSAILAPDLLDRRYWRRSRRRGSGSLPRRSPWSTWWTGIARKRSTRRRCCAHCGTRTSLSTPLRVANCRPGCAGAGPRSASLPAYRATRASPPASAQVLRQLRLRQHAAHPHGVLLGRLAAAGPTTQTATQTATQTDNTAHD